MIALIVCLVNLASKSPVPSKPDTSENTMDPTENENQALLLQAANLAAQYDYDGAITPWVPAPERTLQSKTPSQTIPQPKTPLTAWPDVGEGPFISFQPLIADTARAFDDDDNAAYYARNSLTVSGIHRHSGAALRQWLCIGLHRAYGGPR